MTPEELAIYSLLMQNPGHVWINPEGTVMYAATPQGLFRFTSTENFHQMSEKERDEFIQKTMLEIIKQNG